MGRDFQQFVVAQKFQALFQAHLLGGIQAHGVVTAGGTGVGHVLLFADVDVDVVRLGRHADDHPLVHLRARFDEQHAAVLGVEEPVCDRLARFKGDERAGIAAVDVALVRLVFEEDGVHHPFALGLGQKLALVAEQAARGDEKFQPHARADGAHVHQLALALAHALEHGARAVFGHVYDQPLDGLVQGAVDGLIQHLGGADLEFVPFAAHIFDEDRQVHLAAAAHLERLGGVGILYLQRDVAQQFAVQPVAQVAGGDELALFAGEGAVVDGKGHLHRRLADLDEGHRLHAVGGADGVADVDAFQPRKADDVARLCPLHGHTGEAFDLVQVDQLAALVEADDVVVADGDFLVGLHAAALDPADADPAHIVVIVDGRDEQLQRRRLVRLHGRDMVEDGIEQGREVLPLVVGIARGGARPARTEDDGAFQLVVGGVQVDEKLQDLVLHLGDARVGAVDLVDDDDQLMV